MDTGRGEQKCACNLHQEESRSDFYRGSAENISGYRKDMNGSSRSKTQHHCAQRRLVFSPVRGFREPFLLQSCRFILERNVA